MDLYKIGVKIFVANPQAVNLRDFIAVFHRWIQQQTIEGHQLIDVHDYSHVHNGPGILLVAHEGNFSMDQDGGRLGLLYYRKRPLEGGLESNLKNVLQTALQACKLLESEPELNGIKFKTDEVLVVTNDRLLAPNDAATRAKLESVIAKVLGKAKLAPQAADPRERLAFVVSRGYSSAVTILAAHRQHSRRFEDFKYVYPVLSRRSHGISIGLNVNPDKVCNFDCIYCQVDRSTESAVKRFDLAVAEEELREMLEMVRSGEIAQHPPFNSVARELLRLNDIALSGDAEPTTLSNFSGTIQMIARVKPAEAKIVLITDAGGLDRSDVRRGLEIMDANNGEVWAKLDAGTEDYFKLINRTKIPFRRILKNISETAKVRPVIIQSLFLKVRGVGPSDDEITAYCQRLRDIGNINPARAGINPARGGVKLVQVYTLARKAMTVVDGVPAWQFVTALSNEGVDAIAERVTNEAAVKAESFYGG